MPTVTSLEPQAHDRERINLFLDGCFAFGVAAAVVLSHGVRVGDILSELEIRALETEEVEHGAYGAALNFLSFRPRSRREIETYLHKRKVEPHATESIIERLSAAGLIDDRDFARFWLENRQTFRPRGTRALRSEMRQKGIDNEVIDEVLEGIPDEEEAAFQASASKLRPLAKMDDREFYRKLLAFLQRRGFPYSAAQAAAKRRLAERGGEVDVDDERVSPRRP